jgi:hypothetical protein
MIKPRTGMWHAWERPERHIKFWSEKLKERYQSQDPDVDVIILLKWT